MNEKTILKNLFAPPQPASITATVKRRLAPTRYELTDDSGLMIQAESTAVWSPGSRVIVQAGRIVASAGIAKTIRVYEV